MSVLVDLDRVERVGEMQNVAPGITNRIVVPWEPYLAHSPFIVQVEDFMQPGAALGMHPHRGFETATFVLEGQMHFEDHLGGVGRCGPGDIEWTTAGSGIFHGGGAGAEPVHALQLWLNLPSRLKGVAPRTQRQGLEDALTQRTDGATITTYGTAGESGPWSVWPLRVRDIVLEPGAVLALPLDPSRRLFLYGLEGEASVGPSRRGLRQGDIGWYDPSPHIAEPELRLNASRRARLVAYDAPPIDEPVVLGGPFVMNTDEEIAKAFADLRRGELVRS
jgi:redox-sensitive bicupin YhaK (pirin superfamily)